MSRLISMLSDDAVNHDGLHAVARQVAFRDIALAHGPGRRGELTIDFDSYPDSAHGHQEGAVYNGHYHETCGSVGLEPADGGRHQSLESYLEGRRLESPTRAGTPSLPWLPPASSLRRTPGTRR